MLNSVFHKATLTLTEDTILTQLTPLEKPPGGINDNWGFVATSTSKLHIIAITLFQNISVARPLVTG